MSLPPLVTPADELTVDEVKRYSRHLIIPDVGMTGQKRLKNAKVLVVGAGGLGSPALLYLAAAGVGTLGIVDFDVVDESNLQRQIIHGQSDIGRSKAESARDSIREINPLVEVRLHEVRLEPDNAVELFEQFPQLTQRRMGPGSLDRGEAFSSAERGPRFGNRPGDGQPEPERGPRRHRLRLAGSKPAGIRDLGFEGNPPWRRHRERRPATPPEAECEAPARQQQRGGGRQSAAPGQPYRCKGATRLRSADGVGNHALH